MDKKYKLFLAKSTNVPQGSIVGDFKSVNDESFICEIIVNDNNVRQAQSYAATTWKLEDKYIIYITEDFLYALQDEYEPATFELYHELGHIELGHFETITNENEDMETILFNQDIEADEFVVSEKGLEFAISVLKTNLSLKGKVDREMGLNGTPESVKGIRNLRKRIANLEAK